MLRTQIRPPYFNNFSAKVSLLVGKIFRERTFLSVKVSIVPGEKVKDLCDPQRLKKKDKFNCGEIINSKKALMYNQGKGEASAEFRDLRLTKIDRKTGKKSSDSGMEETFSIIFWTELNWENMKFQLCIPSMPVVVVNHDNLKTQAMATIAWDNAGEESFVEREHLPWGQVIIVSQIPFSNFSCMFLNPPQNFSNLNCDLSNLLDTRNLQEQVKKTFCYKKLF